MNQTPRSAQEPTQAAPIVRPVTRRRDDPLMRTAEFSAVTSEEQPAALPASAAPLSWAKGAPWVMLGGALGGLTRFGFTAAFPAVTTLTVVDLPWATFLANVLGSLILGGLTGLYDVRPGLRSDIKLLVGTGFCGALTTLSTFVLEIGVMLGGRYPFVALQYVVMSIAVSLAMLTAGYLVTRAAFSPSLVVAASSRSRGQEGTE